MYCLISASSSSFDMNVSNEMNSNMLYFFDKDLSTSNRPWILLLSIRLLDRSSLKKFSKISLNRLGYRSKLTIEVIALAMNTRIFMTGDLEHLCLRFTSYKCTFKYFKFIFSRLTSANKAHNGVATRQDQ